MKTFAIIIVELFLSVATANAEIYKFVDEKGIVHFSNIPTDRRYRSTVKKKKSVVLVRSRRQKYYEPMIKRIGRKFSVDHALINAVIKAESDFNPNAVSRKGAAGLMQLMPETAKFLKVKNRFNARQNVEGGVKYLKQLLKSFDNNLSHALAAYNAGEKAVRKYKSIPPYPETQNYVRKVLAYYRLYKDS